MIFLRMCIIFLIFALIIGYFCQNNIKQYLINPNYRRALIIYSQNKKQKNIVMLGDSLTYRADWIKILNRDDIANMGIDRDTTAGYLNRLGYIMELHPQICFIEGGINDLKDGYKIETIIGNIQILVDSFRDNNIVPVITKVLYLAKSHPNAEQLNVLINKLNIEIDKLAQNNNIIVLDLNGLFLEDGFLSTRYSLPDGIHLNNLAYEIWSEEIVKILAENFN